MILHPKIEKTLRLIDNFIELKSDFIIGSLDLYVQCFHEEVLRDCFDCNIFPPYPSLRIFISEKNYKIQVEKKYLGIHIFPPIQSGYGKLYLKMIELYEEKIDFIVLNDTEYQKLQNHTHALGEWKILGFSYYRDYYIWMIDFKISQISTNSVHSLTDVYRIIFQLNIIYKCIQDNNIKEIFQNIEKKYISTIQGISGNADNRLYTGVARNIQTGKYKKINTFHKGDIIIAENTSVNYMKYIVECGGIVTINSNVLSHASIVSRELGLPLILGVEEIFLKIFDGDTIEMNSQTGKITIIKRFWES